MISPDSMPIIIASVNLEALVHCSWAVHRIPEPFVHLVLVQDFATYKFALSLLLSYAVHMMRLVTPNGGMIDSGYVNV